MCDPASDAPDWGIEAAAGAEGAAVLRAAFASVSAFSRYVVTTLGLIESHILMDTGASPFDVRAAQAAAADAEGADGGRSGSLPVHRMSLRMQLTGRGLELLPAFTADVGELTPDIVMAADIAAAVSCDFPAGGGVVATSHPSASALPGDGANYAVCSYECALESGLVASARSAPSGVGSVSAPPIVSLGGGPLAEDMPPNHPLAIGDRGGFLRGPTSAHLAAVLPIYDVCSGDIIPPAAGLTMDAHGFMASHAPLASSGRAALMLSPTSNSPDPSGLAAANDTAELDAGGDVPEACARGSTATSALNPRAAAALNDSFTLFRNYSRLLTTVVSAPARVLVG